jgi:hypothetical protein
MIDDNQLDDGRSLIWAFENVHETGSHFKGLLGNYAKPVPAKEPMFAHQP